MNNGRKRRWQKLWEDAVSTLTRGLSGILSVPANTLSFPCSALHGGTCCGRSFLPTSTLFCAPGWHMLWEVAVSSLTRGLGGIWGAAEVEILVDAMAASLQVVDDPGERVGKATAGGFCVIFCSSPVGCASLVAPRGNVQALLVCCSWPVGDAVLVCSGTMKESSGISTTAICLSGLTCLLPSDMCKSRSTGIVCRSTCCNAIHVMQALEHCRWHCGVDFGIGLGKRRENKKSATLMQICIAFTRTLVQERVLLLLSGGCCVNLDSLSMHQPKTQAGAQALKHTRTCMRPLLLRGWLLINNVHGKSQEGCVVDDKFDGLGKS
eukprot:161036-Pelagomonas_calceolata.AAC.9